MEHHLFLVVGVIVATSAMVMAGGGEISVVRLDHLDLNTVSQGWGQARAGRSVDGRPLTLAGNIYTHGLGTHAESRMLIDLKGSATQFTATVGVDDEVGERGAVRFEIRVDGKKVFNSGVMRGKGQPKEVHIDLVGARRLELMVVPVGEGIDFDHADWCDAKITLVENARQRPVAILPPPEPLPVIAMGTPAEPAIHGPRIVGATTGRPFLFLIPATGEGPLRFTAHNLPAGLSLDPKTGIITGVIPKAGTTQVELHVTSPRGTASRRLTIVAGDRKLALTPPMGWNSWNCWAGAVDDAKVRAAADAMVSSGLAAHGFQYINIDDTWEGERDANGEIRSNKKFPDMKALADYVHSKGLKLGIYSSPGPLTCAGFEGSYQHEDQDARTYAKWGVDYLKYDWCTYSEIVKDRSREEMSKPYRIMRRFLDRVDRDIVYSLCQYGMEQVWEWGGLGDVGGNSWRTTGDITDTWVSMSSIGFSHNGREKFSGPGHWNDPDMLVVGKLGWGPRLRPTRLTPNEQLTHISLWCMLAAPLLIGCDMTQLDEFTLALLTNDEVLEIDQDPLGQAARRLKQKNGVEVWVRPLYDGTLAVALFNRGDQEAKAAVTWAELGLSGAQTVRDLWQRKDLGSFHEQYEAMVARHGVVLVKIGVVR